MVFSTSTLRFVSFISILGNSLFIFWISFNALDEGFQGTFPQKASYLILITLLLTNTFLILKLLGKSSKKN